MEEKTPIANEQKRNAFSMVKTFIVRVIQGAIIGAGAILPGISGGVLCVVFGIYRPMMAVLAHPFKNLKLYWKMFIPIAIGWAAGFVGLAGAIAKLLSLNAAAIVSLFVGLIAGTFPSLLREGAKNGKSKGMWIALAISTIALLSFFYTLKLSTSTAVTPSFGWYLFCGALWGISLIVPGMSSSSLLMFLGLYQPMSAGIAALDFNVLIPFAIGIVATVLLLARLVNHLFDRHYGIAFYCVIGFVIASTIPIIPLSFTGWGEAVLCIVAAVAGFAGSFFMDRWSGKLPNQDESETSQVQ
jgi:putative membrane protein